MSALPSSAIRLNKVVDIEIFQHLVMDEQFVAFLDVLIRKQDNGRDLPVLRPDQVTVGLIGVIQKRDLAKHHVEIGGRVRIVDFVPICEDVDCRQEQVATSITASRDTTPVFQRA